MLGLNELNESVNNNELDESVNKLWLIMSKKQNELLKCVSETWPCYSLRHINLYRMFFAYFSVNSKPILMKFCKDYFWVTRWLLWNFQRKILYIENVRPSGM